MCVCVCVCQIIVLIRKNSASDLKMKIYNESLSREKKVYWKKYILEIKVKANLVIPVEKKSKDTQLVGQKKNHG